mgnify:CR=1 FL=1
MKKRIKKGSVIVLLVASTLMNTIYSYADTKAIINATTLNVRNNAGTNYETITTLKNGEEVTILNDTVGDDNSMWVRIDINGKIQGYVKKTFLKEPVTYQKDSEFEKHLEEEGFPDSYKENLRLLHAEHPNWIFKAQKTNLDWNDVIRNENIPGKNLVPSSSVSSWKSIDSKSYDWNTNSWIGMDGSSWVSASKEVIEYFMDPRNFLDDKYIFQFMEHGYNENNINESLSSVTKGTFLEKKIRDEKAFNYSIREIPINENSTIVQDMYSGPGVTTVCYTDSGISVSSISGMEYDHITDQSRIVDEAVTYESVILDAGKKWNINPLILASMIVQEQGVNSSSDLISGNSVNYPGIYNFFNIEAYQTETMNPVTRGLWYASQSGNYNRPWNTVEKSIYGGAEFYSKNYIETGQDTFYLKKFNVQGDKKYNHQYMSNVQGAAMEGARLSSAYKTGSEQDRLEFKIPVYENMPSNCSPKPEGDNIFVNIMNNFEIIESALVPTSGTCIPITKIEN